MSSLNEVEEYDKPSADLTRPSSEILNQDDGGEKLGFEIPSPEVVTRDIWGAAPRLNPEEVLRLPASHLLLTHTAGEECHTPEECARLVKELQTRHMEQGMPDIQYNFLIGGDGNVYEGRGWYFNATKDPVHQNLNGLSLDVAFIGSYKGGEPSDRMITRATDFIEYMLSWSFLEEEFTLHSLQSSLADEPDLDPPQEIRYDLAYARR